MAFDIQKRTWSQEILSAAEIKQSYFCPTVPAGTSAGVIPAEIAKGLGLSEGVSVVMAGHDQPCGAFGAGLVRQGSALSAGSYECLCSVGDKPAAGEKALSYSFNTYCHVCDGSYLTLAFFPGALCVNWFLELLYPEAERGGLDGKRPKRSAGDAPSDRSLQSGVESPGPGRNLRPSSGNSGPGYDERRFRGNRLRAKAKPGCASRCRH